MTDNTWEAEIGGALARVPGRDAAAQSDALCGLPGLIPAELAPGTIWRGAIKNALALVLQCPVIAAVREELAA